MEIKSVSSVKNWDIRRRNVTINGKRIKKRRIKQQKTIHQNSSQSDGFHINTKDVEPGSPIQRL